MSMYVEFQQSSLGIVEMRNDSCHDNAKFCAILIFILKRKLEDIAMSELVPSRSELESLATANS